MFFQAVREGPSPPPRHRVHNCHGRIDTPFGSKQCNVRLTVTPIAHPNNYAANVFD